MQSKVIVIKCQAPAMKEPTPELDATGSGAQAGLGPPRFMPTFLMLRALSRRPTDAIRSDLFDGASCSPKERKHTRNEAQPWRSGVVTINPSRSAVTLIWQESREFGCTL